MRKAISAIIAITMLFCANIVFSASAVEKTDDTGGLNDIEYLSETANQPAFPEAEGAGKYTRGARNAESVEVYHVTNLNKTGEGSFADALSKEGRIIVFDVGGTIYLDGGLKVKGNTTILGQTAPGDGITLAGGDLQINGDNIIVRYLRIRPSDVNGGEADALGGRYVDNVILDHCSVSWSVDEGLTLYGGVLEDGELSKNITMQYCLGAESLRMSNHHKGAHGYGAIWGGDLSTYHHNLLAHNDSRNPRICGQTTSEIINNVIYNWGGKSAYGAEGHSGSLKYQQPANTNWENNYYKYGPSTSKGAKYRIFEVSPTKDCSTGKQTTDPALISNFYFNGNYTYGYPDVTSDNLKGILDIKNGNMLNSPVSMLNSDGTDYRMTVDETAEEAYEEVLKNVGVTLPKRDSIDARIVDDVRNGTGRIINRHVEVGGFIDTETVARVFEIPTEWLIANGLENMAENDIIENGIWKGYTLIEAYVNDWTAKQSSPTNPHITVTSPVVSTTANTNTGTSADENWHVMKDIDKLAYTATVTPEIGTIITKVEILDGENVIKTYTVSSSEELISGENGVYTLDDNDIVLEAGTHFVMSRAYNDKGESTTSPTSIVYVNSTKGTGEYTHKQIGITKYDGLGSSSIDENGVVTIGGSGKISGTDDRFDYMYKPVTGDFDYIARIVDIPKSDNNVLSGVMLRETLDTSSKMAMLADGWLKGGENIRVIQRNKKSGSATFGYMNDSSGVPIANEGREGGYETTNYPLPKYMKVSRKGNDITLAVSNSGIDWTDNSRQPYTIKMTDLADTVYIGFAVDSASGQANRDYYTMAQFDSVIQSVATGACNTNINWSLYDDGELVISGSGESEDYDSAENVPWYEYKDDITSVNLPVTVTKIGANMFNGLSNIRNIKISSAVTKIGDNAFANCGSDLVICCDRDSAAYNYAKENGIKFSLSSQEYIFDLSADRGKNVELSNTTGEVVLNVLNKLTYRDNTQSYEGKPGELLSFTFDEDGSYKDTVLAFHLLRPDRAKAAVEIYNSADLTTPLDTVTAVGDGTNPIKLTFDAAGGNTYVAKVTSDSTSFFLVNAVSVISSGMLKAALAQDKSALKTAIDDADKYNSDEYTPDSFEILTAAILAAERVYNDNAATQIEVNNAVKGIETAIAGLVENETKPTEIPIETGVLELSVCEVNTDGDNSAATILVSNGKSEDISGMLIVCVKSSFGRVKYFTSVLTDAAANKVTTKDVIIKDYESSSDKIEVYYWNNIDNIMPLCNRGTF